MTEISNESVGTVDAWLESLSREAYRGVATVVKKLKTSSELENSDPITVPYAALGSTNIDLNSLEAILFQLWRRGVIEMADFAGGSSISKWDKDTDDGLIFTSDTLVFLDNPAFEHVVQKVKLNKRNKTEIPLPEYAIKNLFALSESTPALLYQGVNKVTKEWIYTKGKTQPWAILKAAARRYDKHVNKKAAGTAGTVKLSLPDILTCIDKDCSQKRNWEGSPSGRKRLGDLAANIRKILRFSKDELYVENTIIPHLVFSVRKSA